MSQFGAVVPTCLYVQYENNLRFVAIYADRRPSVSEFITVRKPLLKVLRIYSSVTPDIRHANKVQR